jgi:hypothetical protein
MFSLGASREGFVMSTTTYFVVQPYRLVEGELVPGDPIEKRSADAARFSARLIGGKDGEGAVAFSRSGDPSLGDFEDAVVLGAFGVVPDEFMAAQG